MMGKSCCVPGCHSNYDYKKGKVRSAKYPTKISSFSFPKDDERLKKWLHAIQRPNWKPTKYSFICARHFDEKYILTIDRVQRPDGTFLEVKRDVVKLSNDAIPTKFDFDDFSYSDYNCLIEDASDRTDAETVNKYQAVDMKHQVSPTKSWKTLYCQQTS